VPGSSSMESDWIRLDQTTWPAQGRRAPLVLVHAPVLDALPGIWVRFFVYVNGYRFAGNVYGRTESRLVGGEAASRSSALQWECGRRVRGPGPGEGVGQEPGSGGWERHHGLTAAATGMAPPWPPP